MTEFAQSTTPHRLVVLGPDKGVIVEQGDSKVALTWDEALDLAWSLIDLNTERLNG